MAGQIYKIGKQCKRDRRDIAEILCIHRKSGNLKIVLKDKMQVWKEYKQELFNKENEWSGKFNAGRHNGPCQNIIKNDVVKTL